MSGAPPVDLGPAALGLLRIATASLMLAHPVQKFLGWPEPSRFGLADPFSLVGAAGVIEAVAGTLLLVGYATRPAAFVLSGTMAAAYFIAHAPRGFFPIANGGEPAALFCFALLAISALGPGWPSLDGALRDRDPRRRLGRRPVGLE